MSIVIIGAGPNLGAAVARRFGREGMSVGLIARDESKLASLAEEPVSILGNFFPSAKARQRQRPFQPGRQALPG